MRETVKNQDLTDNSVAKFAFSPKTQNDPRVDIRTHGRSVSPKTRKHTKFKKKVCISQKKIPTRIKCLGIDPV